MVAATREQLLAQQHRRSDKPPKLPPRDMNSPYPHDIPKVIMQVNESGSMASTYYTSFVPSAKIYWVRFPGRGVRKKFRE